MRCSCLHYKYLSIDYVAPPPRPARDRSAAPTDRRKRWGHQFDFKREQLLEKIADLNASAVDVLGLGARADAVSAEPALVAAGTGLRPRPTSPLRRRRNRG